MPLSQFRTCVWFTDGDQTKEAAEFYTTIFPDSKIVNTQYYTSAGIEHHGHAAGEILTIDLVLNGQKFMLLNGGKQPNAVHNNAVSFIIECKDQAEVDYYWDKLAAETQACGWCTDKWGIPWQVTPKALMDYMRDKDMKKVERTMTAMMTMVKLDIEGLTKAYEGRE